MRLLDLVVASALGSPLALAVDARPVAAAPTCDAPATAVTTPARLLRDNDLVGLVAALPAAQRKALTDAWAGFVAAKPDDEQTEPQLDALLAPGGFEHVSAAAKPFTKAQLVQAATSMSGFAAMLPMMMQSAPTPQTAAVTKTLQQLMGDVAAWLPTSGLDDPVRLGSAMAHVSSALSSLGVASAKELKALSFATLLERGGPALAELKQALVVYGLDADALLGSITATAPADVPALPGGERVVTVAFTAFSKPCTAPLRVRPLDGAWGLAPSNRGMLGGLADSIQLSTTADAQAPDRKKPAEY